MSGQERNQAQPAELLTRREREVLALLAQGHTGPEIAEHLTLAVSSVKWHTQHLYSKLGVNSKKQAIARAYALGWLNRSPLIAAPEAGYPGPTPAPLSVYATLERQHNLPVPVTRFFGRERDIAQLIERLGEHRLVTLTGSGGVGKTRLSLRAAADVLADFPDGVWFAELAPLADPALVAPTVAAGLGLHDEAVRPILDTLANFLRHRQALLVLDNCEHVLEACARLADRLLAACPRVKIMASSREPLGLAGEAVMRVPSLPFPAAGQAVTSEPVDDYAAVRLFTDRVRLMLPDYQPAPHSAAIARICQRLDGIPLALEMAAARLNTLTTEELADRLDETFRLLTGGSRTALPRHQTLRATLDWSYQLLSGSERRLLKRLSVFAGGCSLAAAEAVCADPSPSDGLEDSQAIGLVEVVEVLAALVAKSMVSADQLPGGETRYHLLETVRQYAQEKMREASDGAGLRTRHRDYFLSFAEATWRITVRWGMVAKQLEADLDNVRLAVQWSFDERHAAGNVEAGPVLVRAFNEIWPTSTERDHWYRQAVAWCQSHPAVSADLQASVLGYTAFTLSRNDPLGGIGPLRQAVALSQKAGVVGKDVLMQCLWLLAMQTLRELDDAEACAALLAEAETLLPDMARQAPPDEYTANLAWLAWAYARLAIQQGRYEDAQRYGGESLRQFQKVGREYDGLEWGTQDALSAIGDACLALGQYEAARASYLQAQHLTESAPNNWRQRRRASLPHALAQVDLAQGNLDRAQDHCHESLREAERVPDFTLIALNLVLAAGIAVRRDHPERAAQLAGAAQTIFAREGTSVPEAASLDALLTGWRDRPDMVTIQQALTLGQAMTGDQALAYGLAVNDN